MAKVVDKEKRRSEIALGAMALFASGGFEKTSIREITRSAGMAKGSFYDYFSDKEDLLVEIARIIFSSWKDQMTRRMKTSGDPMKQISILIREGTSVSGAFEQFILLYFDIWRLSVNGSEYPRFHSLFRSFLDDTKAMAASVIRSGKKEGSIRKDINAEATAAFLVAQIDGLLFHYMALKPGFSMKETISAFMASFIRGITAE